MPHLSYQVSALVITKGDECGWIICNERGRSHPRMTGRGLESTDYVGFLDRLRRGLCRTTALVGQNASERGSKQKSVGKSTETARARTSWVLVEQRQEKERPLRRQTLMRQIVYRDVCFRKRMLVVCTHDHISIPCSHYIYTSHRAARHQGYDPGRSPPPQDMSVVIRHHSTPRPTAVSPEPGQTRWTAHGEDQLFLLVAGWGGVN